MKYFKLKLIVLFLFVLVSLIALASIFGRADYFFTQLVLGGVIIFLLWQCFYLIDTTNREVGKFLFSLNYLDSSLSFPSHAKNSFQALYQGLNQATQQINHKAEQKNQHSQWMETVIRRMPFGIILMKSNGEVVFQNEFISELLMTPSLQHLDQLTAYHNTLSQSIRETPLEKKQQSTLDNGQDVELYKVGFKQDEAYEILFLQGINELKGSIEMDAWKRLIRVLTHEIMNSITSISSLASTLHESIKSEGLSIDLQQAAERIETRSRSLIAFTENYRSVSDVKAANKSWFLVSELIQQQVQFLSKELDGISFHIQADEEQKIYADLQQVEQVFINLFLNAAAALTNVDQPVIKLELWQEKGNSIIHFEDNGSGIPTKDQNHIFVPFFTTRTGGKGIGLSLCRQLMQLNNGSVSLKESKEGKTVFELRFPLNS